MEFQRPSLVVSTPVEESQLVLSGRFKLTFIHSLMLAVAGVFITILQVWLGWQWFLALLFWLLLF
jgi:hypothetical protein